MLVLGLVGYEQRSLRWSRLREALWLRSPRSPRTGRVGGRTWLIVIPLTVGFALHEVLHIPPPLSRNFGEFVQSDVGKAMFDGSWGWFAVFMTMSIFHTVLGEELLFRGVLLPRMHGAFGDRDRVANGVLFAGLPPPQPVDHADCALGRHLRHLLRLEPLPERVHRHRRPQRPDRRHRPWGLALVL